MIGYLLFNWSDRLNELNHGFSLTIGILYYIFPSMLCTSEFSRHVNNLNYPNRKFLMDVSLEIGTIPNQENIGVETLVFCVAVLACVDHSANAP